MASNYWSYERWLKQFKPPRSEAEMAIQQQPTTDQESFPIHSDDDIRALFVTLFNRQEQQRTEIDDLKEQLDRAVATVKEIAETLDAITPADDSPFSMPTSIIHPQTAS